MSLPLTRRHVLAISVGSVIGVSGCSGAPFDTAEEQPAPATLASIEVMNTSSEPATVDIIALRDGAVALWQSADLEQYDEAQTDHVMEFQIPAEEQRQGDWRLGIRLVGSDNRTMVDIDETNGPEEMRVKVEIDNERSISTFTLA